MFVAHLKEDSFWSLFLVHPVLRKSLEWLTQNATISDCGNYSLGESNWYANIHGYETLPETECCWENHLHTIDIQYLISGCEGIRWTTVDRLGSPSRYLAEKDRQEFEPPKETNSMIVMRPGMFAIFMPGEAHCPKISLGESNLLRKAVVKIPVSMLMANQ